MESSALAQTDVLSINFSMLPEQERAAKEATEGAFVTYKQQLGFGVHVLVMMGTFYALGHTTLANISSNRTLVRGTFTLCPFPDLACICLRQCLSPVGCGD